ncbi:MAG: efflux RND transporter periplasmic adaptor subunit [Alphaproteobacteria bacterium]|nr:efflux RND transporter periplasmic adaptor subunit [Alphaproteobacteria bacterium]
MIRNHQLPMLGVVALIAFAPLTGCGEKPVSGEASEAVASSSEYERGPHRGRMLRDGDFAIEMTIFEDGVEPEFHVFAYLKDKPLDPSQVQLTVELTRLGGKIDRFAFNPREDYLRGGSVVQEPHSFDVKVEASYAGAKHAWSYPSYEGRTTIEPAQAAAAGVKLESAGPAVIEEEVALTGRVALKSSGRSEVRAWYPGRILSMTRAIGDPVKRGETLATVRSSDSLQTYAIPAPISGVVMERNTNVGDVTGSDPLFVIADQTKLHAQFIVYPRDAEKLRAGQPVALRNLGGERTAKSTIDVVLPSADMTTQTMIAYVELPNASDSAWVPGQVVEGEAVVATQDAALAVRTRALQRFRDFTVVFAQVGDTYEVRMLELGRQSSEWTEVLGGIAPGDLYVSDNAFLIRADIEKSGASHDH